MPIVMPNSVYLRVPRTGSSWACRAILKAVQGAQMVGADGHAAEIPEGHGGKFVFCFIRNPNHWIRSRWAMGRGYVDEFTPLWDADLEVFKARVTPQQVLQGLEKYTKLCDYVGVTENARADLIEALTLAGETFREDTIKYLPPHNVTDYSQEKPWG